MTPFQQFWADRASRYGLSVAIPFTLALDGETLTVPVLLRQFGAANGMLLVTDHALIRPRTGQIVDLGYGYSCLSEPESRREDDDEAFIDMLLDWGWSGDGSPPTWLRERAG